MHEILYLIVTFSAGVVLGTLFFGGLWLTVKKVATSNMPALLVLGSFVLRMGITLLGIYYIAADTLPRLLLCLLGFVAARFMVIHLTKSTGETQILLKKEASHEA